MEYGNVQKAVLGIGVARTNTPYAIQNGIDEIEGVYVSSIEEDSGAAEAELREGDIIKRLDDIKIKKYADLTGYLSSKRPGDTIQVLVDRSGERWETPVILKKRQKTIVPEMGMEVKNLTEEEKERFNTDHGVMITGVPESYRGYDLEGKVIVGIAGKEIKDIQDARNAFGAIGRYGKTDITMLNEEGEKYRLIFQ